MEGPSAHARRMPASFASTRTHLLRLFRLRLPKEFLSLLCFLVCRASWFAVLLGLSLPSAHYRPKLVRPRRIRGYFETTRRRGSGLALQVLENGFDCRFWGSSAARRESCRKTPGRAPCRANPRPMRQRTLPYANRREQGAAPQAADPQVGHKTRPVALRTADPARRRAARFPRPGISPDARGAEGGKTVPRVPQGAVCDQLAGGPPPNRLRRDRVNGSFIESRTMRTSCAHAAGS